LNIYLYIEIAARELDSKLLLATLAVNRGHSVVLSDMSGIIEGIKKKTLSPGIFHDKSLTPNKDKISSHEIIIKNGFIVSSIDEENNLINYGYEEFAKNRYSEQTLSNATTIFGWGLDDVETLKRIYPNHASKIHMTGSPRIDLLKPNFAEFWGSSSVSAKFKKPYLLVASNCQANNVKSFHETIKHLRNIGHFKNDLKMFKKKFDEMSESYQRIYSFIEAIKHLSANNDGYEIVLRPHPAENIDAWKVFLEDVPNVHVIREGSIVPWIRNSFALVHNGCTTAIEATILGKPVVTYMPIKLEHYTCDVPNSLGFKVEKLEDLPDKINDIFKNSNLNVNNKSNENIDKIIAKKFFFDKNELAAEKIIKIWEKNQNLKSINNSNWLKFEFLMKKKKIRNAIKRILKKIYFSKFNQQKENYKFPPLKEKDIINKVKRLQNILGIKKEISCKLLSERTILLK
jgi:surface carbohydrate biosynthesis protein